MGVILTQRTFCADREKEQKRESRAVARTVVIITITTTDTASGTTPSSSQCQKGLIQAFLQSYFVLFYE